MNPQNDMLNIRLPRLLKFHLPKSAMAGRALVNGLMETPKLKLLISEGTVTETKTPGQAPTITSTSGAQDYFEIKKSAELLIAEIRKKNPRYTVPLDPAHWNTGNRLNSNVFIGTILRNASRYSLISGLVAELNPYRAPGIDLIWK